MHAEHFAIEIIKKLVREGHIAYFAGGWVRDFVMGHPSEDVDIATSASPKEILDLFPRTILVGLQFGVVVVAVEGHQFEVSTFRKDVTYLNGRKPERIEPSTPEGDALRRDFTINGMFYDPLEKKIHDYVGGVEDIERQIIKTIGNPYERFFEDRLRMMRAFRFAARFGFTIESETQNAIRENAILLFPAVAVERVWQEFSKMHAYPRFDRALLDMHRLGLLEVIFPSLKGLHLKELEKRVAHLEEYPLNAPSALFLASLFPDFSADEMETLGKGMRIPNKEIDLLSFYAKHRPFPPLKSRYENALFYAHPHAELCLASYATTLKEPEREAFLKFHRELKEALRTHVDRLRRKETILRSETLKKLGIPPGRKMGAILKESERLAVDQDVRDEKKLLELLKVHPIWQEEVF